MTSLKISQLPDGSQVDSNDELVVARGGHNYKLTAAQVNALGLLRQYNLADVNSPSAAIANIGGLASANNLSDVADAATALSNLGGVSLTGPRALQLYQNNIVVDPTGNGDYTTIGAAWAAAGANDIIWVFGNNSVTAGLTLSSGTRNMYVTPGATIVGPAADLFTLSGTATFNIWGPGKIYANTSWRGIIMSGSASLIADHIVIADALDGITITSTSNYVVMTYCRVNRGGSGFGLSSTVGSIAAGSKFVHCQFVSKIADAGAYSTVPWNNAPFYGCYFEVGTTNIFPSVGNVSNFSSSGGVGSFPAYGNIYVVNNVTQTAISIAGTPVQVLVFNTNGTSLNTVPDHTQDHIFITDPGDYMVSVSATVNSVAGGGSRFEMTVRKNNGATLISPAHVDRNIAGGGGVSGSVSMNGVATLAANDTVEVWIANETGTENYIVENVSLVVNRLG